MHAAKNAGDGGGGLEVGFEEVVEGFCGEIGGGVDGGVGQEAGVLDGGFHGRELGPVAFAWKELEAMGLLFWMGCGVGLRWGMGEAVLEEEMDAEENNSVA